MRATFPIITCDHEDGCDQWTLDWYSALASNWRDLMAQGWSYNPHALGGEQLCPEHAEDRPVDMSCRCRFTHEGWVNVLCPRHRGDDER